MSKNANDLKKKEQVKKWLVYSAMVIACAVFVWFIFKPSKKQLQTEQQNTGLKHNGLELVASEAYDEGTTDFRTIIIKLKEQNPDAIYIAGYKEIAYLIKQLKEQRLNPLLLTTAIFEDPEIIRIVGNSAEGIIFTTFFLDEDSKEERTRAFFKNYENKFNVKPDGYAATSYDAVYLIAEAIKNNGNTSESIKKGLYKITEFPGLLGIFSIDVNGDVVLPIRMKTMQKGDLVNLNK